MYWILRGASLSVFPQGILFSNIHLSLIYGGTSVTSGVLPTSQIELLVLTVMLGVSMITGYNKLFNF